MKSFEGYLKQTAGDTYLLLAGGGIKPISDFWHKDNDGSGSGLDADLLDGKHADDFLLRLRRTSLDISSLDSGMMPPALLGIKGAGYPLYTDPEFASGNNSIAVYNNSGGSAVTHTRQTDSTCGNSSGYVLKIHSSASNASPYGGGWYFGSGGVRGGVSVCIFRAKIPSGYSVVWHSNSIGTNGNYGWLTDQAGTGKWEWYAHMVEWGTASISNTFFFTLNAAVDIDWYLAYANVINITSGNYDGLRTRYSDSLSATRYIYGNPFNGTQDVSGSFNMSTGDQINMTGSSWDGFAFNYYSGKSGGLSTRFYNGALTEIVRFLANGNVGIGTSSPGYKFHVNGNAGLEGALYINGVADAGAYSQGGYDARYSNIILRGDSTYGVSGITFMSYKGSTNINNPSDVGFIQYHAHGVTASAYATTPTEAGSGERTRLVIGVGNDADNDSSSVGELLWLQTAGANDLKHYVVNTPYTIWDLGNLPTSYIPFVFSGYCSGDYNWGWNPLSLSNFTHVYGKVFHGSFSSDIAVLQFFLASGPESSTYACMNMALDGNIQCLGRMYASLGFVNGSDINLKKDIKKISNTLPLYEFSWKSSGEKSFGFIAQELKLENPTLAGGKEGNMYVDYNAALSYFLAKLSNMVEENNKNINDRINMLEKRILDLELENQDLKERLNN